jgi:hypothetical protein
MIDPLRGRPALDAKRAKPNPLPLRLDRLRLRGPSGAKDEFLLAATVQNLRKLAKLITFPEPIFAA